MIFAELYREYFEGVSKFTSNPFIISNLKDLEPEIIKIITNDQLFEKGINDRGEVIGTYAASTAKRFPEKVEGTPYTLKVTGRFYKSIFLTFGDDYIDIDSSWENDGFRLVDKYSYDIIGLTSESKDLIVGMVENAIIEGLNAL